MFLPHPLVERSVVGSLRDREVACSASDRQGSNFESCVWRAVSSHSSHHPQEVLQAQFSLYVIDIFPNPLNKIIYIDPYNKPCEITVVSKADLPDKIIFLSHAVGPMTVGPMARRTNGLTIGPMTRKTNDP